MGAGAIAAVVVAASAALAGAAWAAGGGLTSAAGQRQPHVTRSYSQAFEKINCNDRSMNWTHSAMDNV